MQFENLVLNNRPFIHHALGIAASDIVSENPFYQRKTYRHAGCQIDYLIQTRFNTLYICEIKSSKNPIDASIIQDMQQKLNSLVYPKGYSCRPVLIHVNGVTEDLLEREFISAVIDFSEGLMNGPGKIKHLFPYKKANVNL